MGLLDGIIQKQDPVTGAGELIDLGLDISSTNFTY